MVGSTFVTDAEWGRYINGSLYELYDLLVAAYGSDYYATSYSFTTTGSADTYALPSDFYKLLGVDLQVATAPNGNVSLRPFNFAERNRSGYPNMQPIAGGQWWSNLRYRLNANTLWLTPRAMGGQTILLWYVPKLGQMVGSATITLDPSAWGRIDPSTETYFVTSGELTIGGYAASGQPILLYDYAALGAADAASSVAQSIGGNYGVSGVIAPLGITATASLNVITLTIPSTVPSVAMSSSSQYAVCSTDTIAYGETSFDGLSGWLEYVIVDAAIKAMQKEESDVSVLMAQKKDLRVRLEQMAANRDVGTPGTVADVYATGNGLPW
jgi:hypothetical protein